MSHDIIWKENLWASSFDRYYFCRVLIAMRLLFHLIFMVSFTHYPNSFLRTSYIPRMGVLLRKFFLSRPYGRQIILKYINGDTCFGIIVVKRYLKATWIENHILNFVYIKTWIMCVYMHVHSLCVCQQILCNKIILF